MAQRQFRSDDTSSWPHRYGNGSDGALTISADTTDSTANTTITGTASGTSATVASGTGFAAGKLVLIHQTQQTGAGNWELNKISSIGGGTNWTMAYALMNTYGTGAQVYLLKEYSSATIDSGKTLTVSSWNGSKGGILALLVNGAITIAGNINANGNNASNGTPGSGVGFGGGGSSGGLGAGNQGEGTPGGSATSTAANGNGGGGGGNGDGRSGAGGGHSSVGGAGSVDAIGGAIAGSSDLTTMVFGGGGGGGGGNYIGAQSSGAGGAGAGIVILIYRSLTISGGITLNGGRGGDTISLGAQTASGSGGAGGSLLLKGQTTSLGTNLITASGGAMGTGFAANGAAGSQGRIHIDYSNASTVTGSTTPSLDSRQDNILVDTSAAQFFLL